MFKNMMKNKVHAYRQAGFTLMELLIVIGVLGILAAGLLAAIDPFEQLKKARDTNNRSAAIELLGSTQRYYATHGYLPWFKMTGAVYDCLTTVIPLRVLDSAAPFSAVALSKSGGAGDTDMKTCIDSTLLLDGEIKDTFFEGLATTLYVASGSPTKAMVCFPPEGKSNLSDPQTKWVYDATAKTVDDSTACTVAQKSAGVCLQCFE
ncbi:TPA: hypothetical protein DIU27_02075 [Candidatus Collierbacteria bacterium]|uniref:Uncharacterized protein n=1 Tax=Candidatus Collierbacteria bacterium GW2011_GWB2_44_22 TaxID=1618387 RepID=A0A0G1KVR6_9BACT|nr:MAG: hypothetical protein UW31_C0009G0013 [Candidatus Collierbacteria bacterium GW2011_GWA2_44_13]KKT51533.1 MAG: hypothetical protein UW42_C0001G0008 [Candidatus Collierbacteria bacterium GW2011_GWB1_44_197]KKT52014.1 MAG: hypothetical protein UW44_C0005G0056 [Candidatus Collierbacteria bacterium GW2011_GWB2_44_22]KKT62128.1 MAG: hypothetical protein UW56_C0011G0013 [Candidatus Collierbacteria bacterium GW2011_GWD1_44_27]KKT66698.1 MAG: hypothetical protein UW58_C0004G0047 [Candidatus Colli